MHLRPRPWTKEELAACPFFIKNPLEFYNDWQKAFAKSQPLYLECGCGKGVFIAQKALDHPEINWLGIDLIDTVLGLSQRHIKKCFGDLPVDNLRLVQWDIMRMDHLISADNRIDRIYINFCNPWPRHKQHKKRLTHPRQLEQYRHFLIDGGEIHFKTDDSDLFRDALKDFKSCHFSPRFMTDDLHANPWPENTQTEHEIKFTQEGIPIKAAIFVKEKPLV